MLKTVAFTLALATTLNAGAIIAAHAVTPLQLVRAEQAVKLAECKLQWLQANNPDRLAMYRFLADCLGK